ncbi:nitrite reductase small subunit NirD [Motiliproteus sediminis]|uniref:nitrite reductase small subunit NirD n=1 Tax=Motiliproteus sediminis TaxID=1468178 RepID=UPI001AEFB3A7|nr:nitrite reductase small subunit NirD [Motiliproteus sediminis]
MTQWTAVCELNDIAPDTGVCALVQGQQVAIFRQARTDRLFAIGNFDPVGKANVLSRGLLAQLGEAITVASPLYKQHYCLRSGTCLENGQLRVPVYAVRVTAGQVEVAAA